MFTNIFLMLKNAKKAINWAFLCFADFNGRHKSFRQIQDIADSYLAVDGLDFGYGN